MIFESPAELRERVEVLGGRRAEGPVRVVEDTSNYLGISPGMVVRLEGSDYLVTGEAKEGRFGIEEQPKFWVKYAVDLTDGAHKILKLVFHESFSAEMGRLTVRCRRSPDKESRVLAATSGDPRFMQGRTVRDCRDNNVRVLDVIGGETLFHHVHAAPGPHEQYYREKLPGILRRVVGCIEALEQVHRLGLHHGDVRNDHIIIEADTGQYRWIDFDLEVNYVDYDVFSLGNLITYAVGKGIRTCREARATHQAQAGAGGSVGPGDALLLFRYLLANLQLLLPFVSPDLNELCLRFSAGVTEPFGSAAEVARDLTEILDGRLL